ncbi:type I polyketide synthase [Neorhodopirellula pilleata]|uniref:Phthiocerol/phenolphthiocerol synthesis polyketide synthase type I PpsE n=1 Tax=Neorhodopirellula pilleata TaxID=2714738 RepID=A0A5C6A303_9BACT|nr:type I polyketide synthase [Neorhodopirellula pilleata]TWT93638.1 Phthiocerol/phenolphthiocerol synthesis polyketide synthase type I PpsE [Neorhodopirellula pilleata]
MSEATIAITATFTAEPVRLPLASWMGVLNDPHAIEFAPYGQVLQSLVDPKSVLATSPGGINVVLLRLEDWAQSALSRLSERGIEFCEAVVSFTNRSSCPIIVCLCPDAPELDKNTATTINEVQQEIAAKLSGHAGIEVLTSRELLETYPVANYFDGIANRTAHIPYTAEFYTGLGTLLARRINRIRRKPVKVVVVDCDNTLWNGVCGELGPHGVRIEEGHRKLQQRLIELQHKGMLLALCSKNKESDVWDVFNQNDSMLLQQTQITAAEINWNSKSSNLRRLANTLGLSTDSFVFLDDNPVEIAEVQANCPTVVAIRVPQPSLIPSLLDHIWPFDLTEVNEDDQKRSEHYKIESRRQTERQESHSMRHFLENLELQVRFQDIDENNLDRIAQLTQRTNQFNTTLRRRNAAEVRQLIGNPEHLAFAVEVSDKFGDYGLVGFVDCQRHSQGICVDTFVLSCRALGRGVEHHMIRHVGQLARNLNLDEVHVTFVHGDRNKPAADFLSSFGEELGRPCQQGIDYRYPVNLICTLDPISACENTENSSPGVSGSDAFGAEGVRENAQVFGLIANDFQTVDQVLGRLAHEAVARPDLQTPYESARNDLERELVSICCQVLNLQKVGVTDSLHDLGATSLQLVQIHSRLVQRLDSDLSITNMYSLRTVRDIAEHLSVPSQPSCRTNGQGRLIERKSGGDGIAVVGMAGRFPGADSISQFWDNLANGVNCIVDIPEVELNLPSDSPLRTNPNLVRKAATVRDADKFDAKFFGVFPKEAQVMDPQHRLMLETCWHALEDAGYCPDAMDCSVGVFAGCYMDTYILSSLASRPELLASLANSFHGGDLLTELGNDKDYLATRISFLLNLHGPAMTVQTACSTSLVAIIQACQSLELGQCDMALAGGSTLKFPQQRGYLYSDGGMVSPDGVCRSFDADARGTVFGEGVAAVLLKRVEDAVADGDDIYAVIKGWGINNDGRSKMSYTAPSVDGQSQAVLMAHQRAGISADTISYVEAHGTGTTIGDPIEIDALTRAFRQSTSKTGYCAIGSVKSNIGHLDVAAGVTGLIKTCLAMRHGTIPPSLNFNRPNPNIDFEKSPFFVVTEPLQWTSDNRPRRAGLSSFGVGGTNAHIVVEEPPAAELSASSPMPQLISLSARSPSALEQMSGDLAKFLSEQPGVSLADVAYTLQVGRKTLNYSRVLVAEDTTEASERLSRPENASVYTHHQVRRGVPVAFLFPGQGAQHVNMAIDLYESHPVFRTEFDRCCELLVPELGFDLKEKLFTNDTEESTKAVNQTTVAQPAIFAVSYASAKCFEHAGIVPSQMIGHSVGEFVAACLAGVFSLSDALKLIAFRGRSMQQLPPGNMMAIRMTEAEVAEAISGTDLELAAINGPTLCVVAGPVDSIEWLKQKLEANEVVCRMLQTSHAFHSSMMEPVVEPLAEMLKGMNLSVPAVPIISSVTGQMLSDAEATDPLYWARHLRNTVRFTDSVEHLLTQTDSMLLEVGPGQTLCTLARQHPACPKERVVLSSSPHAKQSVSSYSHLLLTLGRVWQAGGKVDWKRHSQGQGQGRRRVHLPTYPFERQRHWFSESEPSGSSIPESSVIQVHGNDLEESARELPSLAEPKFEQQKVVARSEDSDITQLVIRQQLHIMKQQLEAWNG